MEDENLNKNNNNLENQPIEADDKKKNILEEVFEYAESLSAMFVVMLLIFTFIARPATVDGYSMLPTLNDKDRIVISKAFYQPRRGDIVVVANTADKLEHKNLCKRIVAVGGQTIDIDFEAGEIIIDGETIDEPYIMEPTYLEEGTSLPLTIPEGELFVMGDNRNESRDSRSADVGTVKEGEIVGRCLFRFLPINKFGKP